MIIELDVRNVFTGSITNADARCMLQGGIFTDGQQRWRIDGCSDVVTVDDVGPRCINARCNRLPVICRLNF